MSDRKRILFISPQPFFEWRGSPIRVAFDTRALAESGYAVDLLTLPVGQPHEIPGVTVTRVRNWMGVKKVAIGPSLPKLGFDVSLLLRARKMLKTGRYVAIHGVEEAAVLGALLAARHGCKLVYEKHSDPGSYKKGALRNVVMGLYARAERFAARRADAVIGTGPGLVKQVERMAPDTIAVHIPDIPSSLVEADPAAIAAARARIASGPDEILFGFVGSFAVYQGVDLLFGALPRALKASPHVRMVIVGGTPEEIDAQKALLAQAGVGAQVSFLGKIPPDELPAVLSACDVLMSPRRSGINTPLKLLDYMKAGRAILATDNVANRLIVGETTAHLVPTTVEGLADGIQRLAADADYRAQLASQGRRLVDERYNFRVFKAALADCYAQVLSSA